MTAPPTQVPATAGAPRSSAGAVVTIVRSMVDSLSEYLRALLRHWISIVVGVGGAILTWIPAFTDPPIDNLRALGAIILGVAVFCAQFLAFHDVRRERDALKSEWMVDIDIPAWPLLEETQTSQGRFNMVTLRDLRITNRSPRAANLLFRLIVTDQEGTQRLTDQPYSRLFWQPRPEVQDQYMPNPAHVDSGGTRQRDLGFLIWKNQRAVDPKDTGTNFELQVENLQTGSQRDYPLVQPT
jgi:hypothetical protein